MAKRKPAPVFKTAAEARAAFKEMCDLAEVQIAGFERRFRMPFPHLRKRLKDTRAALRQLAAGLVQAQRRDRVRELTREGLAIIDRLGLGGRRG